MRRAIEVGRVPYGHGGVFVCGVSGLGIGPDVSVVVRVDEPTRLDRPGSVHGGRDLC